MRLMSAVAAVLPALALAQAPVDGPANTPWHTEPEPMTAEDKLAFDSYMATVSRNMGDGSDEWRAHWHPNNTPLNQIHLFEPWWKDGKSIHSGTADLSPEPQLTADGRVDFSSMNGDGRGRDHGLHAAKVQGIMATDAGDLQRAPELKYVQQVQKNVRRQARNDKPPYEALDDLNRSSERCIFYQRSDPTTAENTREEMNMSVYSHVQLIDAGADSDAICLDTKWLTRSDGGCVHAGISRPATTTTTPSSSASRWPISTATSRR